MTVDTVPFVPVRTRLWVVRPDEPALGKTVGDASGTSAALADWEEQAGFRRADDASMAAFDGLAMFADDE
jgi:hypothetical protein